MKTEAIVLRAHGGPEILVRVRAVALNHLDLWVRRGLPHLELEYPHRLGSDVVGEVEALPEAQEAHRALESRDAFGKIVLEVD